MTVTDNACFRFVFESISKTIDRHMRTLPSGNLKNFCADVHPYLCARALKTKRYITNRKLFHAKQVLLRITFNSTLRSQLTLKSKIAFTRTWKDILTL